MAQKNFLFLYPIPQIINFEIKNHGWSEKGGIHTFRERYGYLLNRCIDQRYWQKDFKINFAVFDDCVISNVIKLQPEDKIIKVEIDFKTHNAKGAYPDQDHILNQLGEVTIIRMAGFHMWDCVEKLAKCAHKNGLNVLVDEDLTEFFSGRIKDKNFKTHIYQTHKPKRQGSMFKDFMEARKGKPWLWQNY